LSFLRASRLVQVSMNVWYQKLLKCKVPMTTSTSGSPAIRVMAEERSVKPPEHPAMRIARLRLVDGVIFTRFGLGVMYYLARCLPNPRKEKTREERCNCCSQWKAHATYISDVFIGVKVTAKPLAATWTNCVYTARECCGARHITDNCSRRKTISCIPAWWGAGKTEVL